MFTKYRLLFRALLLPGLFLQWIEVAHAQSIGDQVVSSLTNKLDQRVGGGESDHMASEALRIAGGEFVPGDLGADYPSSGDKVWGTLLTVISSTNDTWSDSNPENRCEPGDIIQFGSAQFDGSTYPQHFTGVIATVNSAGRPNSIFRQNFMGNRTVQQATFDSTELSSGWLRIYRPFARIDRFNEWKFTIVNIDSRPHSYHLMNSVDEIANVTLSETNTAGSYSIHTVATDGTVPNVLLRNGMSYFVEVAKGNEIFRSPTITSIVQLSP